MTRRYLIANEGYDDPLSMVKMATSATVEDGTVVSAGFPYSSSIIGLSEAELIEWANASGLICRLEPDDVA